MGRDLGIEWPLDSLGGAEPVLSDKDAQAPSLAEAEAAGLLPRYETCLAYTAVLRGPG
jgi:dTDP-4-dehydrorhamnose 3,5-epimerase